MTRVVGIVLVIIAVAICLIGGAFLGAGMAGLANTTLSPAAGLLGFGLLFLVVVAPLAGGGIYAILRGRREASEDAEASRQRKILDMVKTRGEVDISDVIIELQSDLPTVQDMIYKLVGLGVFSGYINWDDGVLYSAEAAGLRDIEQCKHCGGNVSFAGKGIVKCPFCGTEYFLN